MRKPLGIGFVALLLVMVLPVAAQDDTTFVRVAYLVPDGPPVDLYVTPTGTSDIGVLLATLSPAQVTDYLAAPSGDYEVTVTVQGDLEPIFGPIAVTLLPGEYLTVATIGTGASSTVELVAFREDLGNVGEGNAHISILHAIEGAPAVDVLADGIPLLTGLTYAGRDAELGGALIPSEAEFSTDPTPAPLTNLGEAFSDDLGVVSVVVPNDFIRGYDIEIRDTDTGDTLAEQPNVELIPDVALFVVATGSVANNTFELIVTATYLPLEP